MFILSKLSDKKADNQRDAVEDQLFKLQDALESANENGLFKDDAEAYDKIMNGIVGGLLDLNKNPPDTIEARKKFSLTWRDLNQCINSEDFSWRFKYCYGGPILLYLSGFFLTTLIMWFLAQRYIMDFNLLWVPSWAFIWGSLGSVLYGFWWLWQNVSSKKLRKVWYVWYLALPIMGSILGALAYLIFNAGFIATTGASEIELNSFIILLSALAGFSSRWAVELLEKITNLIKIGG